MRDLMDRQYFKPQWGVSSGSLANGTVSGLTADLPQNVAIITLQDMGNWTILRLGHQFAVGEDGDLSQPVVVHLATIFSTRKLKNATQLSLTANQHLDTMEANRMRFSTKPSVSLGCLKAGDPTFACTLTPMEVVTFKLEWA